ncbi:OmpH family outer membrane protein [Planctomicrobium piriforme]|uniref:Outer membrane protein n=1 Tax=Planctomicrobium piriforme TaxID=1576369 RepID=A0A1I3QJN0_9PLAN|nr:OmpH family outer membrane protein [Planctomicrobium piriforme]SFJ33990.1 outer membrane protein [Planctomicrobium piriforme]
MKKCSPLTVAVATVGLFVMQATVRAEAPAAGAAPHQIGLIDMAYIFKNYEKFKDQTAGLQKSAEEAEGKAQAMMEKGKQGQLQLQGLQPGSPDFTKIESELIKLKNELETFRQVEQQKIVRQQADVYKTIYLEVQDVVNRYAAYYKYTLVIRFNRGDVADAGNPQAIIQNMNRQVVYYQPQDDITDPILNHLNEQYKKTAGAAAPIKK